MQPGAKEKARRRKCDLKFLICHKESRLSAEQYEDWFEEAVEDGLGLCESVGEDKPLALRFIERLKLRRQVAAAAGKNLSVSLSLFIEPNNLEGKEDLSTMATLCWAAGVWMGRCSRPWKCRHWDR